MRSYHDLQTAERHGDPSPVTEGNGIHSRHGAVTSPCNLTVAEDCSESSETLSYLCNDSVRALIPRYSQRVTASSVHNNVDAVTDRNAALPTVSDLLHLAVTATDFVGDLDPATLEANCANSIDLAADIWSDAHGTVTVPLSLIQRARCALLLEAEAMLRDREAHAEAERLDAVEAGDLDHDGNFIPWERYP